MARFSYVSVLYLPCVCIQIVSIFISFRQDMVRQKFDVSTCFTVRIGIDDGMRTRIHICLELQAIEDPAADISMFYRHDLIVSDAYISVPPQNFDTVQASNASILP